MVNPQAGLLTYRGAVYPAHCDHMGHMNVASYVAKFDEASWSLFCELGLTPFHRRSFLALQRTLAGDQLGLFDDGEELSDDLSAELVGVMDIDVTSDTAELVLSS